MSSIEDTLLDIKATIRELSALVTTAENAAKDGRCDGRIDERTRIVDWLRRETHPGSAGWAIATRIERGEQHRGTS